jgi:hypothetical protein
LPAFAEAIKEVTNLQEGSLLMWSRIRKSGGPDEAGYGFARFAEEKMRRGRELADWVLGR